MKLYILDETFELENKIESVERIFDYIKQALDETEYNFSYMIVDGKSVHDEFEFYLEDHIKDIDEVRVVMLTTNEVVKDNLITIDEYIGRAIPIIENISKNFYGDPLSEDWNQLNDLLEGVGFIFHTLETIDNMEDVNKVVPSHDLWNEYVMEVRSLNQVLRELNNSIEEKDNNLIADILSKRIALIFKSMKERLDTLIEIK